MQFLVSRVGLAVLENKTLLAFAAQLSRKGEPGAPLQLSQCCDLPLVLPQPCLSHQQGKGTEQPVVMGVVSSCCQGSQSELCASLEHTLTLSSKSWLQGSVTLAGYVLSCVLEVGSDTPASSADLQNMNCALLTHLPGDLLYF